MITNTLLFIEDLKGLNGKVAQDIALAKIQPFLDSEYSQEDIDDLEKEVEEKDEQIDQLEADIDALEVKYEALEKKYIALKRRNHLLKRENYGLGNILDNVVIEKGIDIYDISLD